MRNRIASLLPLLFATACNLSTTGELAAVSFTPEECGQSFCSLDFDLAAGTSMDVELDPIDAAIDVSRLTLVAADPHVAVVVPVGYFGEARWRVIAVDEGRTELVALDSLGHEVDFTGLDVRRASRLGLSLESGPAVQHGEDPFGLEVWTVGAGSYVSFAVRPLDWAGGEMMGRIDLSAEMDTVLYDALDPAAHVELGELAILPMAPGDYGASFYGPMGLLVDVVLEVR